MFRIVEDIFVNPENNKYFIINIYNPCIQIRIMFRNKSSIHKYKNIFYSLKKNHVNGMLNVPSLPQKTIGQNQINLNLLIHIVHIEI